MDSKRIIILIIVISFFLLFLVIIITGFISALLPSCGLGRVSNQINLTSKIGDNLLYSPGIEACHSVEKCNNPLVPCVYSPGTGTSCPSDVGYTGVLQSSTYYSCLNRTTCPPWITVGFNEYNGFFIQTQESPSLCGVPSSEVDRLWPLNCVLGNLILNLDDNRYYCSNTEVRCNNNQQLVGQLNQTSGVMEFFCR